jgi:hypothetical protein
MMRFELGNEFKRTRPGIKKAVPFRGGINRFRYRGECCISIYATNRTSARVVGMNHRCDSPKVTVGPRGCRIPGSLKMLFKGEEIGIYQKNENTIFDENACQGKNSLCHKKRNPAL